MNQPVLEFVIASSISLMEQELLSSLKSFWSCQQIMMKRCATENILILIKWRQNIEKHQGIGLNGRMVRW